MRLLDRIRDFAGHRGGNLTLLAGLLVPMLAFGIGMAIDYTSAAARRTKLNAIADSAALSAVTPSMMSQTATTAKATAVNFFNAQAASMPGLTYDPASLNVTITSTNSGLTRTATVTYTANYPNLFGKLLGKTNTVLGGTSSSTATVAPNIDFYLLLDTSPSMAVPATQAGIDWMVKKTPSQGGCAFACHQTCPSCDNLGNAGGIDNYALARNKGLVLRIDNMQSAVSNLMDTAATTATTYKATYRAAVYTFDYTLRVNTDLTSSLTTAKNNSSALEILTVYKNGWLTSSNANNDTDTNYDGAMAGMNTAIATPGNGTSLPGDTPQKVLFFVTDGVVDQQASWGRQQGLMNNAACTTLKNRGIRIAVLYTTYLPLPTNSWYNTYIAPIQPQIGPTLASCASPGLYQQVDTGGDISAAMQKLFAATVASAHLTN